jgi:multidrug efflux system membrane fusion protein
MSIPPDPIEPARRAPERRWLVPVLGIVLVLVLAAVAWAIWGRSASNATTADGKTANADGAKNAKGAGKGGGRGGNAGDPNRAQPVAVATARKGDINLVQTALGTVNALRTVAVRPRVDGQLDSVAFTEGQIVPQGAVLAQIDPTTFRIALEQAQGQYARDAATLANARLDLERYQTLIAQDSIPKQQVDQQAALVKQLEGTVKMDQAQLESAQLQLSYTKIVAPVSGRLGLRQVDPGNAVHQTDTNGIAIITQVDPITVVYTIPQDTLPRVLERLRSNDPPAVQALDRDNKNVLASGKLLTTDNAIDVSTGTVKLKAQLPNSNGKLFPNQFVNVRMVVDTHRNVVVVPTAAVQLGAQGAQVYVVKEDNTVNVRPVKTGAAEGGMTEVTSGLQEGERVITDGVDRIREGSKVEVIDPNAPAGGGGGRGGRGQGQGQGQGQARGAAGSAPGAAPASSTPAGIPAPGTGPSSAQDQGGSPGNMKGNASTDPNAPANAADDAQKREAYKKRLDAMTPEQRDEFMKRRQQRQQQPPSGT